MPPIGAGQTAWSGSIPENQWSIYQRVISEAHKRGERFALGGAFALAAYTGQWRNTKDLDIYVTPRDRERMIQLLIGLGFADYYDRLPYDRSWIFRGISDETIVDLIWAMANHHADVDELWLTSGPEIMIRGERLRLIPPEELLWAKLYIMQKDRCDWPDVLNLVYSAGPGLDWPRLLQRLAEDALLLAGVLCVFQWLCPGRAQKLPSWLWDRLHLPQPPESVPDVDLERVRLLDSRPWFRSPAS
jgi:hypothetical protein